MQVNSIAGSIIKFNLGDSFVFLLYSGVLIPTKFPPPRPNLLCSRQRMIALVQLLSWR